ncbi:MULTISPECIES: imelysin family protein [unclassified Vibrio]|uniref:Imelysin family protein n=1 Tax=Vibrio sp. HB236076 TaxID=3232307 RepID=A0AB39HDF8_9VIBR|nr:imelysin family protein [Vibrio sp. HB161653]MDP5253517.1 imelysin family protein [Vibrio sp. HB161653]
MNKVFILSTLVTTGLLTGCQATDSVNSENAAIYQQTEALSQPVYQIEAQFAHQLAQESKALHQGFQHACQGKQTLESVRLQWQQTARAWMALQGQQRGPAQAIEKSWQIQFWPDKKNTTGRQMSALLRQSEPVTVAQIGAGSVATQGIGALEWLLYDSASPIETSAACHLGETISENLYVQSQAIAKAWQQNPWQELDANTWRNEYVALLSNQLEFSVSKLNRPLAEIGKPRPYFAESWRSGQSMANIKANVSALFQLYMADGHGLDHDLRASGHADIADRMVNEFQLIMQTWPEDLTLFTDISSREGYRAVLLQKNKLEQLHYLLHDEAAVALGVIVGFNATDGD